MPADAGLREQVDRETVRQVIDRAALSNLMTVPASVLMLWLLWPLVNTTWLLLWFAAKQGVCLARWWITRQALRGAAADLTRWGRRYDIALAADGALFGMLGTVLLPVDDPMMTTAMAATLVAIAAIGLVVVSYSYRACLSFTLPLLLPAIIVQLMLGERVSTYIGLGMGMMLLLLVFEMRRASEHQRSMLRLRFGMDELAAQRQAALELAQRSNAAKSQFLATISHEMRTPLHGMLGLARELQRPGPAGDRRQHVQTLVRTGDHLLGIINDVLDYSKIESGHLRLAEQDFELDAMLRNLQALGEVSAQERGLALRVELQLPTPMWVRGDPVRVRQILLNLLGNAIKFTEAGSVTLRAACPADGRSAVMIEVSDTGPGVPAVDRERIFDAFHQLDGSYGRRKGGTGLGLTISRELARTMGGELVCDEPAGAGATFRLTLPLPAVSPPPALPVPTMTSDCEGLHAHVLLVEDNEVNAIVATAILERAGLQVTHAANGERAVELARRREHELILMDCQMPGIDGFEATARIRADERQRRLPPVAIVALTANALEGDRQRCLDAGMDDHLPKPFRDEELLRVLQAHLQAA